MKNPKIVKQKNKYLLYDRKDNLLKEYETLEAAQSGLQKVVIQDKIGKVDRNTNYTNQKKDNATLGLLASTLSKRLKNNNIKVPQETEENEEDGE